MVTGVTDGKKTGGVDGRVVDVAKLVEGYDVMPES